MVASPHAGTTDGSEPVEPIGVVVLGGYLGSGKTTVLSRLVAREAPNPIAVIVNDVGALDIDAALIADRADGSVAGSGADASASAGGGSIGELIRLTNGCVCCTVVDGFVNALRQIGELSPRPTRLIIEASGLADPGLVADYAHLPGFRLDASLVLADATTIQARVQDRFVGRQVDRHLAAASQIVLTKGDLLDADRLDAVRRWVVDRWPKAPVIESQQGVLDWDAIFDTSGVNRSPVGPTAQHADTEASADLAPTHSVWTFGADGPVDAEAVLAELAALPASVPRAKGILRRSGRLGSESGGATDSLVLVSLASGRVESTPISSGQPGTPIGLDVFLFGSDLAAVPAIPAELNGLASLLGQPHASVTGASPHGEQDHTSHHHQGSHQ